MDSFELARTVARDAVRDAARLCLAIRRVMLDAPEKMEKAGREPVTVADYGAQAIVLRALANSFPDDAALAEERAEDFTHLASEAQQSAVIVHTGEVVGQSVTVEDIRRWLEHGRGQIGRRVWAVDPIDGTKGFLRGEQFAIAAALLIDGIPVVGALACPLLPVYADQPGGPQGVIATAIREQGAWIEPLNAGELRSLHVSANHDPGSASMVESVDSGHTDHAFAASLMDRIGVGGSTIRMDSQAKYVAVADGRADIYLRDSREDYRERIWDHAAGYLIVQEAGGTVTDLYGNPLNFNCGATLADNRGVLATNGPLHDRLLRAIKEIA
jgi:3'(2'), 5'-bisphosphate nucleotidase